MAREYARVRVTIWADPDFRRLSDPAQSLYMRLISSPTMNLCGVADWRPRRIAALTAGVDDRYVTAAATELQDAGYVVVDDETEEILVRSFVRHDGLVKTPNIAAAMVKDYAGTASAVLREFIVYELWRLHQDDPDMKGWAVAGRLLPSDGNPPAKPSVNPSVMAYPMGSPMGSGNGSHIPQPSTLTQQTASLIPQPQETASPGGAADAATTKPKRRTTPATQITKHLDEEGRFPLDDELKEWAMRECPHIPRPDLAMKEFVTYWQGVGKPMKDWRAVWKNDMLKKEARHAERATSSVTRRPGAVQR